MTASAILEERIEQFAHLLVANLMHREMNAKSSAAIATANAAVTVLGKTLDACGHDRLDLEVSGDDLRYEGVALIGASLQAARLIRACNERGVTRLTFDRGLSTAELGRFLDLLDDPQHVEAFAPANQQDALRRAGITHIEPDVHTEVGPQMSDPALQRYQAIADCIQSNHVAGFRGDIIEFAKASGVIELAMNHMGQEPSGLLALASYDDIDSFTVGHSVRVCLLALQVANAAGAGQAALLRVGTAALLHDIGKSRIPQEILFKPGRLTDEERDVMSRHSRLGAELLLEQDGVDPTAIGAAFCHHMGPGGSGYPNPTLPFEPSGLSKLIRVCDVFEALTAVRPYKPAMTPVHAYAIMQRMRDGFDPRWLRFFVKAIGLFPLGTRVLMSSGEEGLVVAAGPCSHQPRVRLTRSADGVRLTPDIVTEFVVGDGADGPPRMIERVLGTQEQVGIPSIVYTERPHIDGAGRCACTLQSDLSEVGDGARSSS